MRERQLNASPMPDDVRTAVKHELYQPTAQPPTPPTHLPWQVTLWRDRLAGGWQPQVRDASCLQLRDATLHRLPPLPILVAVPAKACSSGGGQAGGGTEPG